MANCDSLEQSLNARLIVYPVMQELASAGGTLMPETGGPPETLRVYDKKHPGRQND